MDTLSSESLESVETGPLYCYRHPQVETSLRCNRCNKPICAKCAMRTPVGFRCPECMQQLEERFYSQAQGDFINPYARPLTKPLITYILIGTIVLIWLAQELAGGSTNDEVLVKFGANYGPGILQQGELWRLLTSMFLHIGPRHLIFNSIGLIAFGFEIESLYGRWRYLAIYLLSGLFGSLASFAIRGWGTYSAGASGAIFGVIGMQLAFFWFYRQRMGEFGRQKRNSIFTLIAISLVLGFTVMPSDNYAHMGGLLAGFVLGYGLAPRYRVDQTSTPLRIIDEGSLLRRWWVSVAGVIVLVGGLWLALSYWSGGWWQGPLGDGFGGGIATLEFGQTVQSTLADPEGDLWAFEGEAGQRVSLRATSQAMGPYLALIDPAEEVLTESLDSGPDYAQIENYTLPISGRYFVFFIGQDERVGVYELTLSLELE
jgi:membrane associated rhomboid family serine protease